MAKPIIPWMGGKRRLAKHILPIFPEHTCYVEPFAGGAALFFMRPNPAKVEVLNDLNGDLVNLYRVVQHHLEEFIRQYKWALTSRQLFEWEKMKRPETLTDIQRAARFFYLQKLAFGGKSDSPTFGYATTSPSKFGFLRLEEELSMAHLRLCQVHVEHLHWADCVKRYDRPHSLFYLDPPYWETAGYGNEFGIDEYVRMAEVMRTMQGKAILSINDHPDIREIFKGFTFDVVGIQYSVGKVENRSKSAELIIRSW
ncbi:DNA adenine methylase [Paenalcaligenes sp. Me52]|uniref:DNA adenine methylase n=1 Tax=Paenalcaligenes sp. Me52 TaxID=3392038 RepID=UPI003D2BAE32